MEERKVRSRLSINDIPDEILQIIFSYLPKDVSLLQASLTSHRFWVLVEPFRYHNIRLLLEPASLPSDIKYTAVPATGNIHRFTKLITKMSEKPYLRRHVSSVLIRVVYHPFCELFESHNDLLGMLPCLKSLALSPPPLNEDLLSTTSLRHLELDFEDQHMYWSWSILANRHLTDYHSSNPMDLFSRCLYLPSLRCLVAVGLNISLLDYSIYFPAEKSRKSLVTDLRILKSSDFCIGVLPQVLSSIKELHYFTFEVDYSCEGDRYEPYEIVPIAIRLAVAQHADTLIELNIAASDAASFLETPLFGSLAGYSRLRRLAIPETFVATSIYATFKDILPPSLEEMQLQYPMGFSQDHDSSRLLRISRLDRLAKNKKELAPNLKRLIWWDQQPKDLAGTEYGFEEDRERLSEICRTRGLQFEAVNASSWSETPFGEADAREYLPSCP